MPETKHVTIKVNIDGLEEALEHLKKFKHTLDQQRNQVQSLISQYESAITGTVPNIKRFDQQFTTWLNQLAHVANEADMFYSILEKVLEEAREYDIAGIIKALEQAAGSSQVHHHTHHIHK